MILGCQDGWEPRHRESFWVEIETASTLKLFLIRNNLTTKRRAETGKKYKKEKRKKEEKGRKEGRKEGRKKETGTEIYADTEGLQWLPRLLP